MDGIGNPDLLVTDHSEVDPTATVHDPGEVAGLGLLGEDGIGSALERELSFGVGIERDLFHDVEHLFVPETGGPSNGHDTHGRAHDETSHEDAAQREQSEKTDKLIAALNSENAALNAQNATLNTEITDLHDQLANEPSAPEAHVESDTGASTATAEPTQAPPAPVAAATPPVEAAPPTPPAASVPPASPPPEPPSTTGSTSPLPDTTATIGDSAAAADTITVGPDATVSDPTADATASPLGGDATAPAEVNQDPVNVDPAPINVDPAPINVDPAPVAVDPAQAVPATAEAGGGLDPQVYIGGDGSGVTTFATNDGATSTVAELDQLSTQIGSISPYSTPEGTDFDGDPIADGSPGEGDGFTSLTGEDDSGFGY